jgi:hypothetical protein
VQAARRIVSDRAISEIAETVPGAGECQTSIF